MTHFKSHMRHEDPNMSISHIHVLLLSSAISCIASLALPSSSSILVLKVFFFLGCGMEISLFNPFTPKSDQCRISPVVSPENITSRSMKILAFHCLLRWNEIIQPIFLTTSLMHFSLKGREMYFWTWVRNEQRDCFRSYFRWRFAIIRTRMSLGGQSIYCHCDH